jgi:hypothetical protein
MSMPKPDRSFLLACAAAALVLTAGCRDDSTTSESTTTPDPANTAPATPNQGSGIFHTLLGLGPDDQPPPPEAAPGQLGVNTYLWRASLDTISFMPVASADPFGGVIITDWYSPPESPSERFKVNIFILDRQLRSDGIRATVFRQTQTQDGHWIDSPVDAKTATDFENSILTRARQLRIANIQPK